FGDEVVGLDDEGVDQMLSIPGVSPYLKIKEQYDSLGI
ncbi:hypothetical protein Tco_1278951, partial [Tanacetum coccineum]